MLMGYISWPGRNELCAATASERLKSDMKQKSLHQLLIWPPGVASTFLLAASDNLLDVFSLLLPYFFLSFNLLTSKRARQHCMALSQEGED